MAGRSWLLAAGLLYALSVPTLSAPLRAPHGTDGEGADPELRLFLDAYTGLFHNKAQAALDPKAGFASKYHTQVEMPSLGPSVFYVHEKSRQGGAMRYRLRVAAVSRLADEEGVVFVAEHYQFPDQTPLETLDEREAARRAGSFEAEQLSRVEGGAVQFRKREGEEVWEVETKYDSCKDASVKSTTTHISGTLSQKGWFVKAVMSKGDTVVFSSEMVLDRVPQAAEEALLR